MNTQDVITIVGLSLTFIVSIADLFLNAYVANKKRHIQLNCCQKKCCDFEYDSESEDKSKDTV